jgi:hypothetical protein
MWTVQGENIDNFIFAMALTRKRATTNFIYEYSQGGFYEKCGIR